MTAEKEDNVQSLPESKLGTKQHWDDVYAREVNAFNDIGDEGEVWFGNEAVRRMVKYLKSIRSDFSSPPEVLDLGCGNGHLLFALLGSHSPEEQDDADSDEEADDPFTLPSSCLGVDYSSDSIALARLVGQRRGQDCQDIRFEVADLMDPQTVERLRTSSTTHSGWDIVCDKGTLDAIALSSTPLNGELPSVHYIRAVAQLVRAGGLFHITSCNFTEAELTSWFTRDNAFSVEHVVPTPSFSFGGKKGSTTTTMTFRKT